VKRQLLRSTAFILAARRLLKKDPQAAAAIAAALSAMADDVFQPSLRSHKLKGDLEPSWACTAAYDVRIIFLFVEHEGREAILLQTVGTHEDVY
jgi:mRNA interferase YafQ